MPPLQKPAFGSRDWRKGLLRSESFQRLASAVMYQFMRFSHKVQRHNSDLQKHWPPQDPHAPAIIAMWHGQHILVPFLWPKGLPVDVLLSKSADAELNVRVLHRMKIGTIRGSGGRDERQNLDRSGAKALLQLRRSLANGRSIAMVADISHGVARQSGEGIVALARISGRPIIPVAYATSNHYVFEKSWDKATLNLPFGKRGFAVGEPIYVTAADDVAVKQAQVTAALNAVTLRAAHDAGIKTSPLP